MGAQTHFFRKYGVEEGLPRSGAYNLYEDNHGFLWIGVDGGGVAVFDGYEFKVIDEDDGLPSLHVRSILQDSKQRMWLGTTKGILMLNQHTNRKHLINEKNGLTDSYVRSMAEDNSGRIWVGTDQGVFVVEDTIAVKQLGRSEGLLHAKVRALLKDEAGRMWVGTDDGLSVFDGYNKIKDYTLQNGLASNNILYLFEDSKANIWAGTKYGAARIKNDSVVCYCADGMLINNRVRAIAEDENGVMWFGTREGISKFDGTHWQHITTKNGLNHDRIRDILKDRNGNLWFATYFGGISRYAGDPFVRIGLADNQVSCVHGDGNGLLAVGTGEGISIIQYHREINIIADTLHEWPKIQARTIFLDKDTSVWAATQFGLFHLGAGYMRIFGFKDGMKNDDLYSLLREKDVFWLGTGGGVCKIDVSDLQPKAVNYIADNQTTDMRFTSLLRHTDGKLYAGNREGGLFIIDEQSKKLIPAPIDGLKYITSMQPAGPYILAATDGYGIICFDPAKREVIYRLSNHNGLISEHIYQLYPGGNNVWWAGSQKGVEYIRTNWTQEPEKIKFFGARQGFFGIESSENAVFSDLDGILWIGTVDGLVAFDPMELRWNNHPPIIHLEDIIVDGQSWHEVEDGLEYEGSAGPFSTPEHLTIDYYHNHLTFSFTGINLSKPNLTRYKWRLNNFETVWHGPSSRRDITYTNLPAGEYVLEIIGCNEDGVCSDPVQVVQITVTPAFWQTNLFYVLLILAGIGVVILISQLRVKQLKAAKAKLEKIIEERTGELRAEKERVEEQNEHINGQREALEDYNKAVTDSINYAQRIQAAMMKPNVPSGGMLKDRYFILYRPKDIVSGDFYWHSEVGQTTYITAADCTGHGVPGALMSMIGMAYLNEIMRMYEKPNTDLMLNELRKKIIDGVLGMSKDGMDMAMCRIDWNTMNMQYSGANNSLFVVRGEEILEYKSDKMPVGEHDRRDVPFTLHQCHLQPGDCVYLFSDGFPDQFGGEKGKKLMYKRFKHILMESSSLPPDKQKQYLKNILDRWMKGYEQVDDILVIGIHV